MMRFHFFKNMVGRGERDMKLVNLKEDTRDIVSFGAECPVTVLLRKMYINCSRPLLLSDV